MRKILSLLLIGFSVACSTSPSENENQDQSADSSNTQGFVRYEDEKHFGEVRQLTFGGDNAEAYWSFDNSKIVFQATNPKWDLPCDQIFTVNSQGQQLTDTAPGMISTGEGRTTCAFFMPGDTTVVFASTHLVDAACPPKPAVREDNKYVWPIYESFDIFVSDMNGNVLKQLTDTPGYDAEATVSPNGDKIVFTSTRSGDLELYTMNIDGSDVKQITNELGYDGGAFFSPDGTKLVFRASRPKSEEDIATYKSLLAEGLVMPTQMEVFVCNVDGSDMKQITNLGQANWCPFFHPSGEKIIFASNHEAERGFPFNLYLINIDGTGLERVTYSETFDAFPMFSYDGKHLIFGSNRNNGGTRDTNLFIAEWLD